MMGWDRRHPPCVVWIACAVLAWPANRAPAAGVLINEFLAAGGGPLVDEDGDSSDWIELRNASGAPIDLAGWSLTDDIREPRKWVFPEIVLAPGDLLVVFASEKDRAKAGSPLHTNFKLESAGEYLALIRPDGSTIEQEFAPRFPLQRYGISHGLATVATTLIGPEAAASILVPPDGSLGIAWTAREFVEGAGWSAATTGIGYRSGDPGATRIPPASAWAFDGDLRDSAGGRDGSFSGGPDPVFVAGRGGAAGTAIRLDGSNDYVEIPATGIFPIFRRPAYTIAMWVNALPQSDRRVYSEGSTQTNNPLFTMGTDNAAASGSVDIYIRTAAGQAVVSHVKSVGVAFDGTWHHIVWVDENGDARMYIDGKRDARDFRYAKPDLALNKSSIGAVLRAAPSHFIAGAIDDVAVWDAALDEDDIARLAGGVSPSGGAYADLIRTDVAEAMEGASTSLYARIPFHVDDPLAFDTLTLRMKYDDGFIAYLNGIEVARRNAPAGAGWDAAATAEHPPAQAVRYEDVNISAHVGGLVRGRNILAIHGLNRAADDGDFLILPELAGASASALVYRYSTTPTPGAPNAEGYPGFVADTKFSADRGLYDAPFDVEIATETQGVEIRYTTDGTAPAEAKGTIYSGPIRIATTTTLRAAAFRSDLLPTNIDTHTYIFVADVPRQRAPAGYPTIWETYPADYEMDPEITQAPAYRDMLIEGLRSLPSVSIAVAPDDMFGPGGLYRNTQQSGSAWERPASIEYIDPAGGPEFQIDAGLRIQGGASRVPQKSPKHSLRLLFKSKYGASKLEFPLFRGSRVDTFDTITLRANYGNTWIHFSPTERRMAQYIHDQWARDAQIALGQPSARGTYVNLYINGLYWGVYNPSERPDASFASEHFGGTKLDYDAIQPEEVLDGTADAWNQLIALANAGVSSDAAYRRIQEYLDVENLIDYMILNLYGGNWDWPHHNWYLLRKREPGAGFMFYSWDAEHVIESVTEDRSEADADGSPARIHLRLRSNPEYKLLFADHVRRHLFGDGALTPEGAAGIFLARSLELDTAIVGESARWGDYRRDVHSWSSGPYELYTRNNHWLVEKKRLLQDYFPRRTAVVLQQFRADGLYPNIDAPVFAQRGGTVDPGFRLAVENPNAGGTIHYTLDGSDPRVYGTGAVSALAMAYTSPIEIPASVTVRARILRGTTWSAIEEARFHVRGPFDALRVTEIMYHPPGTESREGDEYEFIEIENAGGETLDLTGVLVAGGIQFQFPLDCSLPPRGIALIVADAAAFREKYPHVPGIAGEYEGRLSNSGDTLRIIDPDGEPVISISYDDAPPWPFEADGAGYSLVPKDPDAPGDPALAESWRASAEAGGSPGRRDGEPPGGFQKPGDYNQDRAVDIGDAIALLSYLFGGGSASLPCGPDEGPGSGSHLLLDHNGDGQLDIGDAIALLSYLFQGGPAPAFGVDCTRIPGCPDLCVP